MANKNIFNLSAATVPLAGTEVVPIWNGTATVKVTVADLTAGRAINVSAITVSGAIYGSADGVRLPSGGSLYLNAPTYNTYIHESVAGTIKAAAGGAEVFSATAAAFTVPGNFVPATSGKGIDFSAHSSAAGMTSKVRVDYEEGTWTPVLTNWTNVGTPIFTNCVYTRIGRQVTLIFNCQATTSVSCTAGTSTITGLPFAPAWASSGSMVTGTVDATGSALLYQTNVLYPATSGVVTQVIITVVYFV